MNNIQKIVNFNSIPTVTGPSIENINYFFTTRQGGYSTGAFDSLNLGFNTNDSDINVQKNRAKLSEKLPSPVLWLNQVHETKVQIVNELVLNNDKDLRPTADAAVTNVPGQVLAIQTADCMPIIITHNKGLCLGVVHAGWRGLLGGVIENTVQTLVYEYGIKPSNLVALIGPCIHQDSFEVGSDVMQQFSTADNGYIKFFKQKTNNLDMENKWLLDLPALASNKLSVLDVKKVYISNYCTYDSRQLFYSYRRSNNTGRQAAIAWITV